MAGLGTASRGDRVELRAAHGIQPARLGSRKQKHVPWAAHQTSLQHLLGRSCSICWAEADQRYTPIRPAQPIPFKPRGERHTARGWQAVPHSSMEQLCWPPTLARPTPTAKRLRNAYLEWGGPSVPPLPHQIGCYPAALLPPRAAAGWGRQQAQLEGALRLAPRHAAACRRRLQGLHLPLLHAASPLLHAEAAQASHGATQRSPLPCRPAGLPLLQRRNASGPGVPPHPHRQQPQRRRLAAPGGAVAHRT